MGSGGAVGVGVGDRAGVGDVVDRPIRPIVPGAASGAAPLAAEVLSGRDVQQVGSELVISASSPVWLEAESRARDDRRDANRIPSAESAARNRACARRCWPAERGRRAEAVAREADIGRVQDASFTSANAVLARADPRDHDVAARLRVGDERGATAMPRPSVRTETFREWVRVAKLPLALLAGAVNVTSTRGTLFPSASVTVTASAIAKRFPSGSLRWPQRRR